MKLVAKAWRWLRPVLPTASLGALLQSAFETLLSILF